MYRVQMKKAESNVLSIPAPVSRIPMAGRGRKTKFEDKRRTARCSNKVALRRET